VFNAEDVEGKRRRADGNNAVLANDAILFAAADEFAREEQQRSLAAVDQDELVDGGASGQLRKVDGMAVARTLHDLRALLGDGHLAGRESFFEGEERAGVLTLGTDDGEDRDIFRK